MEFDTYEEVVVHYKAQGFDILDESNGLSWVYMYRVNKIRRQVDLIAWDESSGKVQRIPRIDSYMLDEMLEATER